MEKNSLKNSMYNVSLELDGEAFIYNTLTDNFVINNSASDDLLEIGDADTIRQLEQGGFCVDGNIDENSLLFYSFEVARFNSGITSVFIVPSMLCNLDCEYCFIKDKNSSRMSYETANQLVKFIYSLSRSTNQIEIIWAGGGEPLAAADIIIYAEEKLRRLVKIPITSTIITNGTLLDETTAHKLKDAGISRIVITIDGPADIHNKRRRLKSGADCFALIKENIVKNSGLFEFVVRMVVDNGNDPYIEDLLAALRDIPDIKFTLMHQMECGANCSQYSFTKGSCLRMLKCSDEHKECYWGGIKPYLSLCNALRNSDFIVNVDGGIFKCLVELNDEKYSVGNIWESIKVNANYLKWLTYAPEYANENCPHCRYFPICSSLCAKVHRKFISDFGCEQLQEMFNEIIKNKIKKWM